MDYEEGAIHRFAKYFICLLFTAFFCLILRAFSFLLLIAVMVLLSVTLIFYRGALEFSTLSIFITATMIAFSLIPSIWRNEMQALGRIIVYGGSVAGIFSIIELTFLAPLFSSIWASTQSIRSVSTLYNPNNLGLYSGACLILLSFLGFRPIVFAVCGALISFSFISSGSRTAWVALFAVIVQQLFTSSALRRKIVSITHRKIIAIISLIVLFAIILNGLQFSQPQNLEIEIANRGADLHTGSIRLNNFLDFIKSIDASILLPDLIGKRTNFIQDNFYLAIFNSFGIIGLIILITFYTMHFRLRKLRIPELMPWSLVFLFYLVSGLSGSQLNSFPNNQLFFLSLGAIFVFNNPLKTKNERTLTKGSCQI